MDSIDLRQKTQLRRKNKETEEYFGTMDSHTKMRLAFKKMLYSYFVILSDIYFGNIRPLPSVGMERGYYYMSLGDLGFRLTSTSRLSEFGL